ncbi:HupE/UreJ family protein [Granulosicoccus sp. 3-233]|uniref:HupE/UreJ family protein n=1 Tax=Granulosicoccus sp. 3-233 TaxID=3417969 RepID=UPI003D33AC9A
MTFKPSLTGRLLLLAVLLSSIASLQAHELRPAVADISQSDATVQIAIRANLEALISEIGPEHDDSDDAPQAERYQQLRDMPPAALERETRQYLPTLLQSINLSSSTDPESTLPLDMASVTIPPVGDVRLPRDSVLILQAPLEESMETIDWQWDARYGPIILRADAVTDVPDASAFSQYLQPGERSDPISIEAGVSQTGGSGFLDYIVIGFEHIIPKGLDHILFVIGLFLLAPKLRPIVWQVSMFTIAHTVTLALGITGIITLPASIVEPLIALSITAVCAENLFAGRSGQARLSSTRLVMVFAFGLLHGLGFAGVLSDIGLSSGHFASSLLAFNIGVELGQLSVVLLCFALVGWRFGKRPWYRQRITLPASLIIGAIGLYWFLQRVQIIG